MSYYNKIRTAYLLLSHNFEFLFTLSWENNFVPGWQDTIHI